MSSEAYPRAYIGAENCDANWLAEANRLGYNPGYTPPERKGHYRGLYRWDTAFICIIYARAHNVRSAVRDFKTLLAGQMPSGLIPNQQHTAGKRFLEPEALLGQESDGHTNYDQPALEAQTALEIYHALETQPGVDPTKAQREAKNFLKEVFPSLVLNYGYIDTHLSNGLNDKLIGAVRPEATGRDSGPEWDFTKPFRLPRRGPNTPAYIALSNSVINYAHRLHTIRKLKQANGDAQKSREIFWANDIEMNCIYASNCYAMAEIAELAGRPKEEVNGYKKQARGVEEQILKPWHPYPEGGQGMWFSHAENGEGRFYALDKYGLPIKEVTTANVMPVLLPNLGENQLKSILSLIRRKLEAPYGLSTVANDSLKHDPHYGEKESIWRGPDWMNQDWLVAEGLLLQINRPELADNIDLIQECKEVLWHLTSASTTVLDMWAERGTPIPEFHDPQTARAFRLSRVQWFAWGNLGRVMPPNLMPNVVTKALLKHASLAKVPG